MEQRVTEQSTNHLTTEQLSALLDARLDPREQAACDAHLQTCAQCRAALADLRRTVVLLRALPAPELPRSFALPTNVTYLQERLQREPVALDTPSHPSLPAIRQRRPVPLRRPVRVLSALVAVAALFFLLPGLLGVLPHLNGTSASNTSSSAGSIPASVPQHTPEKIGPRSTPAKPEQLSPAGTTAPAPTATATPGASQHTSTTTPHTPLSLPIIDLGTPQGQLEVGSGLLILGIAGLFVTRRRKKNAS